LAFGTLYAEDDKSVAISDEAPKILIADDDPSS
jgi:hypothetical protein